MKIQCDACHKQEASLFCPADEAALCNQCDRNIHYANKVSAKHKRFTLHHPTSKDTPLCDICKERRAYLFCKEDRAILCRECDIPIHEVNKLTKQHNRFLLTGVKIGASSSYSNPTTSNGSELRTSSPRPSSFSSENNSCSQSSFKENMACDTVSTSSISEYLIETIPGYCMEDLFDASFTPNNVFCKDYHEQNQDLQVINMSDWVPQSQVRFPQLSANSNVPHIDSLDGVMKMQHTKVVEGYKVPSISPPFFKQCRGTR